MSETASYLYGIVQAAPLTIAVALVSLLISIAIGLPVASARLSRFWFINQPAALYTTLFRGIPDLVLMFFLYYGGQELLNTFTELHQMDQIDVDPFWAGSIILGLVFGAYMAETFRGAILAIPHGQLEAAKAFGMTPLQRFTRITFPQMLRNALPGVGNNWLVLLKTTALVSLLNLHDMVQRADFAKSRMPHPFLFYFAVAAIFLLFTSISILVLNILKKRYNQGFEPRTSS